MKQIHLRLTLYPSPQVIVACIWQCCNGVAQRMELEILSNAGQVPQRHASPAGGTAQTESHSKVFWIMWAFLANISPPLHGETHWWFKAKFFIIQLLFQLGSWGSQTQFCIYKHLCTPHQLCAHTHTPSFILIPYLDSLQVWFACCPCHYRVSARYPIDLKMPPLLCE